jgi:hypothetical protein
MFCSHTLLSCEGALRREKNLAMFSEVVSRGCTDVISFDGLDLSSIEDESSGLSFWSDVLMFSLVVSHACTDLLLITDSVWLFAASTDAATF